VTADGATIGANLAVNDRLTLLGFNMRDFAGSERFGVQVQTPRDFLLSLGAV